MMSIRRVFVLCSFWIVIFLLFLQQAGYAEGRDAKAWKNCKNSELECIYRQQWSSYDYPWCLEKSEFCNGTKVCSDNLNKKYCEIEPYQICPSSPYIWVKCDDGTRCIPKIWWCDGQKDCLDGSDEVYCPANILEKVNGSVLAKERALQWLLNQRKASNYRNAKNIGNWGPELPRIAVALALANSTIFSPGNAIGEEITSELKVQILDALLRNQTHQLSPNELAMYVQAMIVTCLDPSYFHGMNLVEILRQIVNSQNKYTNPFLLLTLCKANYIMTLTDVEKLKFFDNVSPQNPFWTDSQAMALMALSCIEDQSQGMISSSTFHNFAFPLKKLQNRDGSIQSLRTTALVMQALFASGEEEDYSWNLNWELENTIKYLISSQFSDGSYGKLLNMYHVMPVLNYKSLVNINTKHCIFNESMIDIKYLLRFGENNNLTRSLELRTTAKNNFLEIMKLAATVDLKYRFKYVITKDSKIPYVYEVSGIQDDPENDTFWYLYKMDKYGKSLTLMMTSLYDVIPKDNEEFIMWYKAGEARAKN